MIQINEILDRAKSLGACDRANLLLSSWEELSQLFLSPQGLEFCEKLKYPRLPMWQEIKKSIDVCKLGFFIDERNVIGRDASHTVLIGRTSAVLEYDCVGMYHIVLMHGAKAVVTASNYAVLHIVNIGGCEVELKTDNTVKVL
ncbi:MAG: hypothetical protein NC411_01115 [Bacteroides sp.]|nr:hypothetical protein [Bacteroides sp.]